MQETFIKSYENIDILIDGNMKAWMFNKTLCYRARSKFKEIWEGESMNKDKDLDDLFSDKMESEIKDEIKKKRSRLNLKLIIIAVASTLVIITTGILALNFASYKYIENSYSKDQQKQVLENIIMNPNEYIGKESCREIGYFKYKSSYEYGKRIGSKVIYSGSANHLGGLAENGISKDRSTISNSPLTNDINKRYSSVYGSRNLYFLYPYVHYGENIYDYQEDDNKTTENEFSLDKENKINDFHFLNEIDNNKIVEMALSFDKEYTYEEVNSMLDTNLITFYWVDNNSEESKQHNIEFKNPAFSVVRIKSIDGAGEFKDDVDGRMENFKAAVDQLKK